MEANTLILALAIFIASAASLSVDTIDFSKVLSRTEIPGFWDGRLITPILLEKNFQYFQFQFQHKFNRNERIVGGNEAKPNAHPYQAGILMQFSFGTGLCGGSLISDKHVLTAAHCPEGSVSSQVILGAHNLFTATEPTQVRMTVFPDNYIFHPEYDPRMFYNDLALLLMPNIIVFNNYIQPIPLPEYDMMEKSFKGEIATVSGWGRTSDNSGALSPVLMYTQNEVKTNEACYEIFGNFVINSTLCAITRNTLSGICNGDSGGLLTIERGGRRVLIGSVSYGALAGCELGYPTGFARITSFMPWISQHLGIKL